MHTSQPTLPGHGAWRVRRLPAAITLALMVSTAALVAAPAFGQTTDGQQTTPAAQDTQTTSKDQKKQQEQQQNVQQMGTVTVTATGRAQEEVTVPYNITAVSGKQLERNHVRSQAELFRSIPGVNFVDSGPRNSTVVNNIRMRGINVDSSALGDYAVTGASSVATYVGMVPLFASFQLFDINRVEVLRGPQGTLYGSGSLGGTVRYIFNQPRLNHFGGSVSASGSSVKYSSGIGNSDSAIFNIPMGHEFAIRINAKHNDYPGVTDYVNLYKLGDQKPIGHPISADGTLAGPPIYYTKKDADTVKQNYGRVALLWKPNDSFNMVLQYLDEADRYGSRRGQSLGIDIAPGTPGFGKPYGRNEIGSPQLEPSKRHVHLTSLEATVDMGFATLTSSTAYSDEQGDITSDNTGFYAQNGWFASYSHYPRELHTAVRGYRRAAFTQEFRLVSTTGGAFDYIAGVFYRNENDTTAQDSYVVGFKDYWDNLAAPLYGLPTSWVLDDNDFHYVDNTHFREVAVYGQGTWHATENLNFTLGARYFRNRYVSDMQQNVILWDIPGGAHREFSHDNVPKEHNDAIFLLNMSWWFNPYAQLYATASQGYRRGGSNAVTLGTAVVDGGTSVFTDYPVWQRYKADTVTNYEFGIKGMTDNLTYTADAFWTNWDDPQINVATTYGGYFAVANLGKARSRGLEFALQGKAGDHVTYGAAYTYTDAKLTEDAYTPDAGLPGRLLPGVTINGLIAPAGTRLPGVSKNRLNAHVNYSFTAGTGVVTFHVDGSYQSDMENSLSQDPRFHYTLPAFTMWNANVGYYGLHWNAILWVKNVGNTKGATGIYKQSYMGSAPAEGFYANSSKLITAVPRTIGVTLTYKF